MGEPEFREAERAHGSLLAPLEKRCLVWLAERMPPWVNSDHLTLLGFIAMVGVGLCYWTARRHPMALSLGAFFLAVNWFGDSLDGTLARVRNRQRPQYGFYVDHVVDTFSALFVLGGLMLSGYMSPAIAAALLIAYYMLSIEVYLATYTIGTFHLSFWIFGPTELRILLAIGNIALICHPMAVVLGRQFLLFDVGGVVGIAGMAVVVITSFVRHARLLYFAKPMTGGE